jgi:hypothetical protein
MTTHVIMDNSSDHENSVGASGAGVGGAGRRPMNAFLLFCKRHRGIVKERYPNLENRNITKILGEWWQSLGDDEKATFIHLAAEFKEHVVRESPGGLKQKRTSAAVTNSKPLSNGVFKEVPAAATAAAAAPKTAANPSSHSSASSSPEPPSVATSRKVLPGAPMGATFNSNHHQTNSGSSSSASSVVSSSSAPKPFKKRFLANIDSAALSVSPEAEHACKALLQLAGVRESSPTTVLTNKLEDASESKSGEASRNGSRSGTASPPESEKGKLTSGGFRTLRDAVWSRVAKTLLKQEEEKGNHSGTGNEDAPLNLSSQCTIRGQTIIEHIIENCLDKPCVEEEQQVALNLNNNGVNGAASAAAAAAQVAVAASAANSTSAEEIKERIYQGLKQDLLSKRTGEKQESKEASALWNLLPHIKLAQEQTDFKIKKSAAQAENTHAEAASENIDATKLSIKHLLAQSPAPVSPRSKSGNSSSKSSSAVSPSGNPAAGSGVSVTLVSSNRAASVSVVCDDKPVNLSTTPPQTPLSSSTVTITATTTTTISPAGTKRKLIDEQLSTSPAKRKLLEEEIEEEDDVRRSSRACKGKRYQEFKEEGRLGRSKSGGSSDRGTTRKSHKSGDSSNANSAAEKDQNTHLNNLSSPPSPFDITAKLNAIPALSLDNYQQRVLKAKNGSSSTAPTSATEPSRNTRYGGPQQHLLQVQPQQLQQPQPRRRSGGGEHIEPTPPKRKSRRTGASSAPSLASSAAGKDDQAVQPAAPVDVVVSS